MIKRPRRNRQSASIRALLAECSLSINDLVQPIFIVEGSEVKQEISAMPGCFRYSVDSAIEYCRELVDLGINAIAPFPKIEESSKDAHGIEALNHNGLMPNFIAELKKALPDVCIFSDIALDPYSEDGHDGLVRDGEIVNDASVEVLAKMALLHARSGADFVAPSDMMDGRVSAIRSMLDENEFQNVGILSYSAKYCSAFYGPFRDALGSAPKSGDKKTYQMNPANAREALLESQLDIEEGADILMVKPTLAYLDIIKEVKSNSPLPVAAYNVSGEYSLIKAAALNGWVDEDAVVEETLLSIKRAGADIIFTYFADGYARKQR